MEKLFIQIELPEMTIKWPGSKNTFIIKWK